MTLKAQENPIPDSCKLEIGTNLSGMFDWATELPFVDLMKNARQWYTKSNGDPADPFNSGYADNLEYDAQGYPTHIPQTIGESEYTQDVATIWGIIKGWPDGKYTVLFDGDGDLNLWGTVENITRIGPNRYEFDKGDLGEVEGVFEIRITRSEQENHVRNIRVLMPGTEATYEDNIWNQTWIDKLEPFKKVRFMDWGSTNNWGTPDLYEWDSPEKVDWDSRAQPDYYTFATSRGVPYEYMVQLMNEHEIDGWVCIPHRASDDYLEEMGSFFYENLDPERHLYVEYSNEIWNWIFDQTHWLNKYGCEETGTSWPEGIVPYIQNALDKFSIAYQEDLDRLTRVVGTQAGWFDVSERIVYNMEPSTFDAVSPTYYFSFNEDGDAELDDLGPAATVDDVARLVRDNMAEGFQYVKNIYTIADSLDKEFVFYEGGQHFTPQPFGVEPTYGQALLDIQRAPVMYDLYNEWFDSLRTLVEDDPFLLMNFSFIGNRSAQYGSWGILETMDQDLNEIPAPKYEAVIDNMARCETTVSTQNVSKWNNLILFPNPAQSELHIQGLNGATDITIYSIGGKFMTENKNITEYTYKIAVDNMNPGMYILKIVDRDSGVMVSRKLVVL